MYIIDGHNLIPKLPGGSLRDLDDEMMLINVLQGYARAKRRVLQVFFDGAPPGQTGPRQYGQIRAVFVPVGQTADEAIRRYLTELGRKARNLTVVSSDRRVQAESRALQAAVISSEDFARELLPFISPLAPEPQPKKKSPPSNTPGMSSTELEGWLDLFGVDPAQADAPIGPPRKKIKKQKRR